MSSPLGSKCYTDDAFAGPPLNVEWDLLPTTTARSPFQAYLEFSLPSERHVAPRSLEDKKASKQRDRNRAVEADVAESLARAEQTLLLGLDELPEASRELRYHFEFDVGSDTPELVKMLWVAKDKDNNTITKAVTDNHSCWVAAAQAVGLAQSPK